MALESLTFIEEKRDGGLKGRQCADGRKQQMLHTKEETASPTVAMESTFLTAVMDAEEEQDVATADLPNAFAQTEMEDKQGQERMTMKMTHIYLKVSFFVTTKDTIRPLDMICALKP